jgi:(heptosyl)LPS beta-1,4-glucosyltransferase
MMKPKISVVINTLNEEQNLPLALRSVCKWASEIIVVDMHSDDNTVAIAEEFTSKVFLHPRLKYFEAARQFAVQQASCDWIFLLDADEIVPQPLSDKLLRAALDDNADVYMIPRLNYLLGAPVKHTGWDAYGDRQLRLFKKGSAVLSDRMHAHIHPAPNSRVADFPYENDDLAIHHFNYLDAAQFIEKLNRYTSIEGQQAAERGERVGRAKAVISSLLTFVDRYVRKRGYRDGWRGFYLSGLMAAYRWITYTKLQEAHSGVTSDAVRAAYKETAMVMIGQYEHSDNKSKAAVVARNNSE